MPLLKWCEEASRYVDQLTDQKSTTVDYVLFTLQDPKKNPTMLLKDPSHMGKGGRNSVETILTSGTCDDVIVTGAFLTSAIDERGSVVSVRRKYVHVMWVGPNVGILVKGKANSFSGEFRDKFPGCALYLQLLGGDIDDLKAETLEHNLLSAGGAHKPTRYSFTNRTLIGTLDIQEAEQTPEAELPPRKTKEEIEAERKARQAEAEAKRQAEEEARLKAEAEEAARQKALDEARQRAEQERIAAIKAQEEARRKAREEEARKRAEADKAAKEAAAKTRHLVQTNSTLGNNRKLLLLISGMPKDLATSTNQQRLQTIVDALGLPPKEIEKVDGANMSHKERRNQLFDISGMRAQYPQLFLIDGEETKFVGDFEAVIYYNDTEQLKDVLGVTTKTTTTTIVEPVAVPTHPAKDEEETQPAAPIVKDEEPVAPPPLQPEEEPIAATADDEEVLLPASELAVTEPSTEKKEEPIREETPSQAGEAVAADQQEEPSVQKGAPMSPSGDDDTRVATEEQFVEGEASTDEGAPRDAAPTAEEIRAPAESTVENEEPASPSQEQSETSPTEPAAETDQQSTALSQQERAAVGGDDTATQEMESELP